MSLTEMNWSQEASLSKDCKAEQGLEEEPAAPAASTGRGQEAGVCRGAPATAAGERPSRGDRAPANELPAAPGAAEEGDAALAPASAAAGAWREPPQPGGVAPRAGASGGAWPGRPPQVRRRPLPALPLPALPLGCGRPEAAVAPPLPRDGGPRRAGPLRGRLLAGAGLRRAGPGGAAGRRVRRRGVRRPAHLRGRHRHLPQPRLVGVLVRGQPGGAAGGAARRRGAGAAQGSRGQPAAGAGARPQPPPLLRLRRRAAVPRCRRRAGDAAPRGPAGPPRRLRQDLLKT